MAHNWKSPQETSVLVVSLSKGGVCSSRVFPASVTSSAIQYLAVTSIIFTYRRGIHQKNLAREKN